MKYRLPDSFYKWYQSDRRSLPFRDTGNYYHTWVSEIMLQQTRVSAVIPSYLRFTERFPDLDSLAKADEEEVLSYWKGLGYYSRARNLLKGARYVMEKHGGIFPLKYEDVLKIPGIGEYTAGAVLSIAFGQEVILIDGNVKRFLSRYFYPARETKELKKIASELLKNRDISSVTPGDHNQALMEIGALVCTPSDPQCPACPVRTECRAYRKGGSQFACAIPEKKVREKKDIILKVYLIEEGGSFLVIKDSASRFFKNHWFFPHELSQGENTVRSDPFPAELISDTASVAERRYLPVLRHSITHHRIQVQPVFLKTSNRIPDSDNMKWTDQNRISDTVVSSITLKILKYLEI